MRLVIAEKPSVAKAYADVIGAGKRQDGYLEGNGYIVSWCVGHLVELAMPQAYDEKYARWRETDLPILPEVWKYQVSKSTRKQFNVLKKLMRRKDVSEILEATDAGREGEFIFRLVYQEAGCKKPFRRIWLSSMEDAAIREAFANPKPGRQFDNLYEAAKCRERADWIIGINATRLFSCRFNQTLNIGRVMTPTLAMVETREKEIQGFISEPFYTVSILTDGIKAESKRMKEKDYAENVLQKCLDEGKVRVREVSVQKKAEKPPLLFDLTTLQREANKKHGFSAQQTLDYAQSLYEKKLLTYPRTDSRYLTSDMGESVRDLILETVLPVQSVEEPASFYDRIQTRSMLNDAKVTDHTALLPTGNVTLRRMKDLTSGEAAVLQLVITRLLAASFSDYRYEETKLILTCGGTEFSVSGKRVIDSGWRQIEPEKKEAVELPEVRMGQLLPLDKAQINEGQTKPPGRYTEGSLLLAMEKAGKEEMSEEAERSGLGTPATRAGIIEKLVRTGFLKRDGKNKTKVLAPTEKGAFLVGIIPEELASASMTADWEQKLLLIEQGKLSPDAFMDEISEFTAGLVRRGKEPA